MPAYRAELLLPRVLPPLIELLKAGEVCEVLVVDDQSPDRTADVARELGATVIETPVNGGPGAARNLASEHAKGDILWFVDSDVVAWKSGPQKIREAFAQDGVKACFGSYDSTPDGTSWYSRYKNLMHRYYHQVSHRDAGTFWAGCGAVDAALFRELGGFDTDTYRVPSIEDIELGYRIRKAGGRILSVPDLLGKHLKIWTIRNGIHTDIYRRALPWSRLMIAREGLSNDLNTSTMERLRAGVAGLFILSLVAVLFRFSFWPITLLLAFLAVALNRDFARFLYKNGGLGFAAASLLYHQFYYTYSASVFVWCLFEYHALRRRNRLHVP